MVSSLTLFKPRDLLDKTFEFSVIIKGLHGLIELLAAAVLVFSPGSVRGLVELLTRGELREDSHDVIATYLIRVTNELTGSGSAFAVLYLVVHGVIGLGLAIALLTERLWAYTLMIGFLIAFIVYQLIQWSENGSLWLLALSAFDAFLIWLTWREYQRHLAVRRRGN